MDNRGNDDPSRGARRYGPSASGPQRPDPQRPEPQRAWSEVDGQDPAQTPGPQGPVRPPGRPGQATPYGQPPRPQTGNRPPGPPPTAVLPAAPAAREYPVARPAAATRQPPRPNPGGPGGPGGRPPVQSRPVNRQEQPSRVPLMIGRGVAVIASVLTLILVPLINNISQVAVETDSPGNAGSAGVETNPDGTPVVKGQNILLVGSDARTDVEGNALTGDELVALGTTDTSGVNTDTIMLIHIPEGGGKATAVSIPRDTWIYDPPKNRNPECRLDDSGVYDYSFANKINSYYGVSKACELYDLVQSGVTDSAQKERTSNETGRTVLIDTVQRLSGLKIDQYAEVNLFGFYLLSEALGGVPVCLNNAVDDTFSGAKFAAGPQEVQGSAALAFVRQRHGLPGGDFDRVRRQQAFLAGALDKVLDAGTLTSPSKLSNLVDAADRSIVLSKGFSLLDLAGQMSNLSSGNVNFVTIPILGTAEIDGKDAVDVDPKAVKAFFKNLDGISASGSAASSAATTTGSTVAQAPAVDPAGITVDVGNWTKRSGMAPAAGAVLTKAGYLIGASDDVPVAANGNEQEVTTIGWSGDDQAAAEQVAALLGFGKVVADDTVPDGHLNLKIGADAPAEASGLRSPGLFAPALLAGQADETTADDAINAGTPGCVN